MNLTRKNRSISNPFTGFGNTLQQLVLERPLAWLDQARKKFSNLPKTNFDLGCDFTETGRWLDAIFRFKLAIWLQPNFPQAWYNLGCCYMKLRKHDKAKNAFKKTLSMRPNHTDAIFMLSSLDPAAVPPAQRPTRMQKQTVIDFFSRMAPIYDAVMVQNQYAGPRIVFDTAKPLLKQTNGLHVLDMGCGTGLATRPWRTIAVATTGIDFCPAMAAVAREAKINDKSLFDTLLEEDALTLADGVIAARTMDIVLCVDTAQYLGELAIPFATAARMLKTGGLFAITIEPLGTPAGFSVNPDTGRFGHHPDYVKKVAASVGLELKKEARVALFPGLAAQLFVFGAKEAA